MDRSKSSSVLVIATRNRHKVAEIRAVLGNGFQYSSLLDWPGAPQTIEDADSFAGNARKKAVELAHWLAAAERSPREDWLVLADDSGLEVDALDGAPGVHSARFAALDSVRSGNSSDTENNAKLLRLLSGIPPERRSARFRCVVAALVVRGASPGQASQLESDPIITFEGICEGNILYEPRGHAGFGYDPLFQPLEFDKSFGELTEGIKNRISHRARALAKLKEWLSQPAASR